ncbi:hypothetical protein K432DRAFT_429491 [Lepidopterella palustris CBS 459.81]|uniref:Uncharacterized protein n=1 Tax=Lepidopterella palustris CBS 459.81 TaxID=1314670 RepID=A0A8E2E155_9PEZI|nr:hypothetical protein K432DRAFT_429491 [Lepidopterella palustris CBS 459.81]
MSRTVQWRETHSSDSTTTASGRSDSDGSYQSRSTAPTEYSAPIEYICRPSLPQYETCNGRLEGRGQEYFEPQEDRNPPPYYPPARSSVDTYASTSEEDLDEDGDYPEYDVPQYNHEVFPTDAIPTTPRDFADLFPTSKRISIRHDDATIDGNMNLRVDTQVEGRRGKKHNCTLFHLRMHDLRTRQFSLRRYCRESGREVCHSIRKYQKPPFEKRPILQRASSAFTTLRYKSEVRPSTASGLKRSDSGYESMHAIDEEDPRPKSAGYSNGRALMPTNTIKLEFSNYAHIDVKRRGAKSSKRYVFEYWGHNYNWKRVVKKDRDTETVSYYLVREDSDKALAHISPVRLTPDQAHEEAARGGWIPPCYMKITDERILNSDTDISDVVVATGLMALVDDCIKRRFHTKQSTQLHIPLIRNPSFKMNMDYIGPKRLIDEVFHRSTRSGTSTRHPTALRRTSVEA